MEKKIAEKFLIALDLYDNSWDNVEQKYMISNFSQLFSGLLLEEEQTTGFGQMLMMFGGYLEDCKDVCKSVLEHNGISSNN